MRIFIPILLVLGFLVIGCNNILGEKEEVETGIRCDQISMAGAMLGDSVDTSIREICKDACLRNVMKYSPEYRCHATSLKLICSCIVTPERKEQLNIIKRQEEKSKLNSECEEICKSKRVCEDMPVNYESGELYDIPTSNGQGNYCDCRCISRNPYPSVLLTGKLQGELGQLEKPKEVKVTPKETKEQEIERLVQGCEGPMNCRGIDCEVTERANCYRYIAVHTENVSWYDKAGSNRIRHCITVLALYTNNASICETEIQVGQERDSCIRYVTEGYVYADNDQFNKDDNRYIYWRERFK